MLAFPLSVGVGLVCLPRFVVSEPFRWSWLYYVSLLG